MNIIHWVAVAVVELVAVAVGRMMHAFALENSVLLRIVLDCLNFLIRYIVPRLGNPGRIRLVTLVRRIMAVLKSFGVEEIEGF